MSAERVVTNPDGSTITIIINGEGQTKISHEGVTLPPKAKKVQNQYKATKNTEKRKTLVCELYKAGFNNAKELRLVGFTVNELKEAGFNLKQLKKGGFSEKDLSFHFSPEEMGTVSLETLMPHARDYETTLTTKDYRKARKKGYSVKAIITHIYSQLNKSGTLQSEEDIKKAKVQIMGNIVKKLKEAGFSLKQLINGYTDQKNQTRDICATAQLYDVGFTVKELKDKGFRAEDFKNNPFNLEQKEGIIHKLKTARFSAKDLKTGGFLANELYDLNKDGGFSIHELVDGGYTPIELKEAEIDLYEFMGLFPYEELVNDENGPSLYTDEELKNEVKQLKDKSDSIDSNKLKQYYNRYITQN